MASTPSLSRRTFLTGLFAILGACAIPRALPTVPHVSGSRSSPVFREFVDLYQHDVPKDGTVTILYPGSGFDLSPLEIGLQLLYNTEVKNVNFIYTEIGDYEENLPTWHDGFNDLTARIENGLDELVRQNSIMSVQRYYQKDSSWIRSDLSSSAVVEYSLALSPAGKKQSMKKSMTLTLAFNTFDNRQEPTAEESTIFAPKLLTHARENYWPAQTVPGKIYPTYFNQDHFDQADIILSKQCGDFNLLQFDYVRAFQHTARPKPRVILTEHPDTLESVRESLPRYTTDVRVLQQQNYGYCRESNCKVGVLIVKPIAKSYGQ